MALSEKKSREGERTWMLRAVREIGKKVNLAGFIHGTSADPASAFIHSQYINVRLRLFHAKKSSGTKPHEGIPEEDVARACSNLTRFCREVLNQQYALGGQSAVMTNVMVPGCSTREFGRRHRIRSLRGS